MTLTLPDIGAIAALWALLAFLTGEWFKYRLQNSIKHEYDRKLEEMKFDLRKREQAARVAKLLAMSFDPTTKSREFNELAWELSLWLPGDLVWEITKCLCGESTAKNPKEILIEIRKVLNNGVDDGLEAGQLVHRQPEFPENIEHVRNLRSIPDASPAREPKLENQS